MVVVTGKNIICVRNAKAPKKLLKTNSVEELNSPFTILKEKLPRYKKNPAQYHIDLIYFGFCKNPKNIKMKEKYGWFNLKDLEDLDLTKEVKYLSKKALMA